MVINAKVDFDNEVGKLLEQTKSNLFENRQLYFKKTNAIDGVPKK